MLRLWKSWLQLLGALAFVAGGLWMLIDALRDPAGAEAGQLWMSLAITIMFGGCAAIFAYELHGMRRAGQRARGMGHGSVSGPLEAVYSNVWASLALAGCVAFAVAGVMMTLASATGGLGWAGFVVGPLAAIVFGAFAVLGAAQLRHSGRVFRRIRVDADGIHDSRIGDTIAWDEIEWIAGRRIFGQRVIEVGLVDPDRILARLGRAQRALARLNRRFGYAPYAIALAGLSVGEAELAAAIHRFRPTQLPVRLDD